MLDGKNKSNYNPDLVKDQEILYGIYNAIIELTKTIKTTPAFDIAELKEYLEFLREEGLIKKGDKISDEIIESFLTFIPATSDESKKELIKETRTEINKVLVKLLKKHHAIACVGFLDGKGV